MPDRLYEDCRNILKNATTILLVDWPSPDVPFALLKAGFKVFSYSPGRYSAAEIDGKEKIVFRKLDGQPGLVDIVNVYRPEEEHAAIIADHVLPLKAKVLWLQLPVTSAKTRQLARENGLMFVEGGDIADVARSIG